MPRKIKNQPQKPEAPKYRCRDCAHSYDWQDRALDGHLILGRCSYDEKSQHGKFCILLSNIQCSDHFKKRIKQPDAEANRL